MPDVRPSPIAGQWYEGDPEMLARAVDEYLEEAKLPELNGEVIAVIAPHAGHRYSGAVAGYAFAALLTLRQARGDPDLVAVLAPMHHPYSEPLITTAHEAYSTPLGEVPVDKEALRALNAILESELGFGLSYVSNDKEHSLEIELPFLQRLFSPWRLPLIQNPLQKISYLPRFCRVLFGIYFFVFCVFKLIVTVDVIS